MELVDQFNAVSGFSVGQVLSPFKAAWCQVVDHVIPHARNNYHPHVFSHRATGLFSMLLVTVKITGIAMMAVGPAVPAFSAAITPTNIIQLTNQSRAEFNLKPLTENLVLAQAAQAKANDMLAKGYFSHNSPDGKTPWDFVLAAGYNYISAGENLAINFTQAENVEDAWMNSPGHKANILNKSFEEIGIGIAEGQYQGHNAIFVVQMFGTAIEQKISVAKQSTPVQSEYVPVPKLSTQVAGVSAVQQVSMAQNLAITDGATKMENNSLKVTAQTSDSAVKVLAVYGNKAVMMQPKPNNTWEGDIPLPKLLSEQSTPVQLKAYDMQGNIVQLQIASFSGSTPVSLAGLAPQSTSDISFFGHPLNPSLIMERFYLLFMAGMLTALVMAIVIKKHIQHLSLIANGSFVVMLAAILWMT